MQLGQRRRENSPIREKSRPDRYFTGVAPIYAVRVQAVTTFVPRDVASCWRVFIDPTRLAAWVPGLRRAQIIAKSRGLASEVHFEFVDSLAYTLVYTYDVERRHVSWQPKLGREAGVTGFAQFEAFEGGTRVTYGLEHGEGRSPEDREIGDLEKLVNAFVAWMRDEQR